MALSLPSSSPWHPLPLCPTPATRSHPSSRSPQLQQPRRHGEEQRRPQPFNPLSLISPIRSWSNGSDPLGPRVPLRTRLFPRSDFPRSILIKRLGPPWTPSDPSLRPILIERLGPPLTPVAVRFPSGAGPARSVRPPPRSLTPLACLSALARARALGRRSNLGRRFLI
jgi:hypothetical protein